MTHNLLRLSALLLLVVVAALGAAALPAGAVPLAQDPVAGEQKFRASCAACHTIGKGRLVGPDLAGVTERRDPEWLKRFIREPDKVLAAGDPLAAELLAEYNNVPMPNLGLNASQTEDILAYLAAPDAVAPAPAASGAGAPAASAPVAAGGFPPLSSYITPGERLFSGEAPLQNGGTACIACHSVAGVGLLGGGALGPDLTHVYTRYGSAGLAASLKTLPFPSMQSTFATRPLTPEEQADLMTFFARSRHQPAPRSLGQTLLFLAAGAGLTGGLFFGMLFFWPRQRTSISQRLRRQNRR